MKAGPETHSTCTGNQVPRYQARSQGMIWCWNPVIDVEDVSILTNDVIEDGDVAMQLNGVTVDVRTRPTILHMMWCSDLDQQRHRRWCYDTNQRCSILINYVTDDNGTWIWSMMSRMTMMFQSCSTMLRTMIMFWLLHLVQRMKTRFKDINTWFKKWRWNQRKSKYKEKKWAQLQLFRTTVSGITTNITCQTRVWIHVIPWW